MTMCMEGTVAHLQGELTDSGVTHGRIHSWSVSLQQIESRGEKNVSIDCKKICAADITGLQLLYVWMQCARLRGVEPALINLSHSLQQAIQRLGLGQCFLKTHERCMLF